MAYCMGLPVDTKMLLSTVATMAVAVATDQGSTQGFLPARSAATRWTGDTVLCYLDARSIPPVSSPMFEWTQHKFERLLAYHDAPGDAGGGKPVDTLFNTFLLLGYDWKGGQSFWPGVGPGPGMNSTDWSDFLDLQLELGAVNIDRAAANVSSTMAGVGGPAAQGCGAALGIEPTVILAVPCPDSRQHNFGNITVGGPSLNLSLAADRLAATQWWVGEAVHRWTDLRAKGELNRTGLLGFYWFDESISAGDEVLLPALAATIHALDPGFLFTWIPYFSSASTHW